MSSLQYHGDKKAALIDYIQGQVNTNIDKRLDAGEWKTLVKETNRKAHATEDFYDESGGNMFHVPEGTAIPMQGTTDGWSKRRHFNKFGTGASYTKETLELSKSSRLKNTTRDLIEAPGRFLDTMVAFLFYFGDGKNTVPKINEVPVVDIYAADGLPIFDLNHKYKTSAQYTYATRTAAYMAPTIDSVFSVSNIIKYWRLQDGDLLDTEVERFLVSPLHEQKMFSIFQSTDNAETTNRSTNPLRARWNKGAYRVLRRGIDPLQWFAQTKVENDYVLNWVWKEGVEKEYTKKTQIWELFTTIAFSLGVGDPRRYLKIG